MKLKTLSPGMHLMSVFGYEFSDRSFCWMMDNGELCLSMIIVKEEHRRNGALHRLLDAAKDVSDHVIIPEPLSIVPIIAAKHGYVEAQQYIEPHDEYIYTMEWRK